jgi:serine/threonine-protein phosphatase 4 regulatory subunit 1
VIKFKRILGSLNDETKLSFVTELERIARDQVWFVRSEAAFALGALAKVVPEEVVLSSLASIQITILSRQGHSTVIRFRTI